MKYKDRAKAEFEHQYKEMLVALKDGIVTGYSVENGLKKAIVRWLIFMDMMD